MIQQLHDHRVVLVNQVHILYFSSELLWLFITHCLSNHFVVLPSWIFKFEFYRWEYCIEGNLAKKVNRIEILLPIMYSTCYKSVNHSNIRTAGKILLYFVLCHRVLNLMKLPNFALMALWKFSSSYPLGWDYALC